MGYSLHSHGFLSVILNTDMTNIGEVLPMIKDIPRISRIQSIDGVRWSFLNTSLCKFEGRDTLVAYTIGVLHASGTYGKIYKSQRMILAKRPDRIYDIIAGPEEIVIKQIIPEKNEYLSESEIKSHTSEALLHVLSWQTMQKTAAPWSIPRPYEIYGEGIDAWKSMTFGMSFVDGDILYTHMKRTWTPEKKTENSVFFKEVLGQTAYILHHLQTTLKLNHRDLKLNNLIVRRSTPITLEIDGIILPTNYEVTLIDFGFACIGCSDSTLFQAGSWFPFSDICYKKGRDLIQLLYSIHCYFPLDQYLTPELFTIIKELMIVRWNGMQVSCLEGFTKNGMPKSGKATYDTGIYEFLRRDRIELECEPATVFKLCL
jgi:serine/threonine protein kinase